MVAPGCEVTSGAPTDWAGRTDSLVMACSSSRQHRFAKLQAASIAPGQFSRLPSEPSRRATPLHHFRLETIER
jgi:hypothetical protein